MSKLYELVDQYTRLVNMAEELDDQTLIDTLDSITETIEDKAVNIAKLLKAWENDIAVIKAEEERLSKRRKTLGNKVVSLKNYLQLQLELAGIKDIKNPLFTIAIKMNPPKVHITNENLIPLRFYKEQEPTIAKSLIAEALKSGEIIPGAELVRERGVSIK